MRRTEHSGHEPCAPLSRSHERTRAAPPRVREGLPYPRGATWDGKGVNFALFSANATRVEACLFDSEGKERERIELPEFRDEIWHGYVPDISPGTAYGFRVRPVRARGRPPLQPQQAGARPVRARIWAS